MKVFSGFRFQGEETLFKKHLLNSEYSVAGFSYGAIEAFEHLLDSNHRIDTLQLFSPAFFQDRDEKFIRTQLLHFKKSPELYTENFYKNSFYPAEVLDNHRAERGDYNSLERLLRYKWSRDELKRVVESGVNIEVFLGEKDTIINSDKAMEFFKEFATVCYIKGAGHTLLK